ncbi:MAG: UDP-N-acetylmuramoyl-tripeptide--D-alanyl-D-alanine ligase [Nitrospinae bacterium]|nr:UDP-N-acetylmuramoyl-tripeptide--D-alanyl-D-alanine ligase [Nitrospinota bacterium]
MKTKELMAATGGTAIAGKADTEFSGIYIDSRKAAEGGLFIAIKGESKNGHLFMEEAMGKGISVAILSEREDEIKKFSHNAGNRATVIKVDDTLKALHDIARCHRMKFDIPVVGITGSNGKSTVKEMAASILSTKFRVLKNQGNFNNHIGLPLTLFELDETHEAAVLEMGMSGLGEITLLCDTARPGYGAVTNIGEAHLESLGSIENVLKAKKELVDCLDRESGVVLNSDSFGFDAMKNAARGRVVSFGMRNKADFTAEEIRLGDSGIEFSLVARGGKIARCKVMVPGMHNLYNALCAAAVAELLEINGDGIAEGLENYRPLAMRMETLEWNGVMLINDAYNANPASMSAAIETLAGKHVAGRKIFVAGDMLELGKYSKSAHSRIGKIVAEKKLDFFVTFGDEAEACGMSAIENGFDSSRVKGFKDPEEAAGFLRDFAKKGDCVLLKGSRGMGMERIIKKIMEN